jgi:hypothetical protein
MATKLTKQDINIGIQSNDGTGDSIRDAFRKTNENFQQLFGALDQPTGLRFTTLSDTPTVLTSTQIIVTSADYDLNDPGNVTLTQVSLVGGQGISMDYAYGAGQWVINNTTSTLSTDLNPTLAQDLVGTGLGTKTIVIGTETSTVTNIFAWRAKEFADPEADQDLVTRKFLYDNFLNRDGTTRYGTETNTTTSTNSSTNLGSYLKENVHAVTTATSSTHLINKAYGDSKISLAGIKAFDPETGTTNTSFGIMTGELLLSRNPKTSDDTDFAGMIAATKSYVDANDFYSSNNLFVTSKGQDYQPLVPPSRRGRNFQYAFASLNKAAIYAEQLIATSRIEVGDYARLITYENGTAATVRSSIASILGNNLVDLKLDVGSLGSDQFGAAGVGQFTIYPGQYIQGATSGAVALIENIAKQSSSTDPETYTIEYVDYGDDFATSITAETLTSTRVKWVLDDDEIVPVPDFWVGYTFYGDDGIPKATIVEVGEDVIDTDGTYHNYFIVEFEEGAAPSNGTQITDPTKWHVYSGDFQDGETIVYNTNVSALQITFMIESGEYYEQYPIKLPANTSIRGDEFRRVIIRPASGVSSSKWANTYFRRDAQVDGLQVAEVNTAGTDAAAITALIGTSVTPSSASGTISMALSSGDLPDTYVGWMFVGNSGQGVITSVVSGGFTVELGNQLLNSNTITSGNWHIWEPIRFGYHYLKDTTRPINILTTTTNKGSFTEAGALLSLNRAYIQEEVAAWLTDQVTSNATLVDPTLGTVDFTDYTFDLALCKRDAGTIVDSLIHDLKLGGSGSTINFAAKTSAINSCTTGPCGLSVGHIYTVASSLFTANANTASVVVQTVGNTATSITTSSITVELAADGVVADLIQAAVQILNQPSATGIATKDLFNPPKNNDQMDVFLMNDANVIRYVSCQNHGGFMQVLDPEGQVKNKSPYTQTASSFSQSIAKHRFAGGMFVDGFSGNVEATPVDFTDPLAIQVTGLRRKPLVPTFFTEKGVRYEVDFFSDFIQDGVDAYDQPLYAATLRLNPLSPGGLSDTVSVTDNATTASFVTSSTTIPVAIEQPSGIGGLAATGHAVSVGGKITSIVIDFPGTGYLSTPYISVGGAILNNLTIVNSTITNASIVSGGYGYAVGCKISIIPVNNFGGVAATGSVTSVDVNGTITGIAITNGGSSWSSSITYRTAFGDLDVIVPAPEAGYLDTVPTKVELVTAGNRSMLANDFTQVNDLGYGIFVTNGGFMENVSMFTYYCYRSYFALNGAQVRTTTGSSVYGEWGLCAVGSDPTEVPLAVTNVYPMVQIATAYVVNPLFPAQAAQGYIYVTINSVAGGYPPLNGSVIEINHGGIRRSYSIGSASPTLNSSNEIIPNVYQLFFNTGNISTESSTGLLTAVANSAPVIIRASTLVKVTGFNPDSISRPSTSLTWDEDPTQVYHITGFSNVQPDNSVFAYTLEDYNYITFQAVDQGLTAPEVALGGNNYSNTNTTLSIVTTGLVGGVTQTVNQDQGTGTIGIQNLTLSSTSGVQLGQYVTGTNILSETYVTYIDAANSQICLNQPTNGAALNGTTLYFSVVQPSATVNITSGTITSITVSGPGLGWSVAETNISIVGTGTGAVVTSPIAIAGVAGSSIIKISTLDATSANRIQSGLVSSPPKYYQLAFGNSIYQITGYRSPTATGQTWAEIDLNTPLLESISRGTILRAGIPINSNGRITTKISIMRASGHDFVDIGTGGYAETRIPNDLYGPPLKNPVTTQEVYESTKGRVYYVSTDQDGNFRVGSALTVNQAQGSVSISVPLDLSNLSSLSLRRDLGPPVNEFSVDSTMVSEADYKVPTEQAVANYINRRLGIDRNGVIYSGSPLGPQFLALDGQLAMKADLNMDSTNRVINLLGPNSGADAANKDYVDTKIANAGTAAFDVNGITPRPEWGEMTGSLQLFNDPGVKTATVATTATSGTSVITFVSLTSPNNYQPGDFYLSHAYGLGIPEGTVVATVGANQISLGINTSLTTTIPAGTVISFDSIKQAATKRYVDYYKQFSKLVDVSVDTATDTDLAMFGDPVYVNTSTNPAVYTQSTQVVNVRNNPATILNTPTSINGGSDISITRALNTVTFKLIGGTTNDARNPITDYHVNSFAQIKQSKLFMTTATTSATAPSGTQTQIQSSLGLAQFDNIMFSANNGWITLSTATSISNGIATEKMRWIPIGGGLLGATLTSGNSAATYLSSSTVKTWLENESTAWIYASDLTPNGDGVQSLGTGAKRWKNLFLSSTATIDGGLVLNTLAKISTNQTTAEIFTATVTTLNIGSAATTARLGGTSGTLTLGNPTIVGTQATQNLYDTVATSLSIGGVATTLNLGNATGATVTMRPGTLVGSNATQNVYNTVATTVNAFGAATTLSLGAASGTTTINNNLAADNITDNGNRVITSVDWVAGTGISIASETTTGPSASATIGNTGILSITGTTNQVSVTAGQNPTLSLPQNIHTGASPQFNGLTLSSLTANGTATINGTWQLGAGATFQATYADLAEWYASDAEYEPGTVLVFGGSAEVTTTSISSDTSVAGVVSTNPAYIMNDTQAGVRVCIALQGRVPVKVIGKIRKGDLLTTSTTPGYACKAVNPQVGTIIGKALADKTTEEPGVIEVAIGRN